MLKKIMTVLCSIFMLFSLFPTVFVYALPPSSSAHEGIDVSRYQGDIDFEQVAASGIQGVYIRSSLGSSYIDPYFEQNYENARDAGLSVGFYHFVTARSVSQARYQAHFFLDTVQGKEFDYRLAMDFEDLSGLSVAEINRIALAFVQTLEEAGGKEAVVYSNAYDASRIFSGQITSYPLWVAEYGVNSPRDSVNWNSWAGWQYEDNGRIPGISGYVDRDLFTGDMYLSAPGQVAPHPTMPPSSTSNVAYTVTRGDTLWGIANLYHTTVAAIAGENQLANPNLIYPGEVLRIRVQDHISSSGSFTYTVQPGDTLWGIALRYHTTVSRIVSRNGISNPNRIFPGQRLAIPGTDSSTGQVPSGAGLYTVKRGDTLWGIARQYGTTVSRLAALNHIADPDRIYPGQQLVVSGQGEISGSYTVQRGDTLWGIAQQYHTTVSQLAAANGISNPNRIYPGQQLVIPG